MVKFLIYNKVSIDPIAKKSRIYQNLTMKCATATITPTPIATDVNMAIMISKVYVKIS